MCSKKSYHWRVNVFPIKEEFLKDDYFSFVLHHDFDSVYHWIHSKLFDLGVTRARVCFIDIANDFLMKNYDYRLNENLDPDISHFLDENDYILQPLYSDK